MSEGSKRMGTECELSRVTDLRVDLFYSPATCRFDECVGSMFSIYSFDIRSSTLVAQHLGIAPAQ